MHSNLFGFMLNPSQTLIVLAIGVLLFGKRLPEVGQSLGKYIREFKKGIVGIEDDIWSSSAAPPAPLVEPCSEAPPPLIESDPAGA